MNEFSLVYEYASYMTSSPATQLIWFTEGNLGQHRTQGNLQLCEKEQKDVNNCFLQSSHINATIKLLSTKSFSVQREYPSNNPKPH